MKMKVGGHARSGSADYLTDRPALYCQRYQTYSAAIGGAIGDFLPYASSLAPRYSSLARLNRSVTSG